MREGITVETTAGKLFLHWAKKILVQGFMPVSIHRKRFEAMKGKIW